MMTLESLHVNESITILPVSENERIILEEDLVHRQLGRVSVALAEAYRLQNELIMKKIELNRLMAERGLSNARIIAETQRPDQFYDDIHCFNAATDQEEIEFDRIS